MNKFKKLYRDFFGLNEATQNPNDIEISADIKDPAVIKRASDQAKKQGGNLRIVAKESQLDPVGHEDSDIDNDGVENTESDKYLKHRRVVRKKAIKETDKKTTRWQDSDGDGKWYEPGQDVSEARLVNNITDYRGGVEYVLRDPAEAQAVSNEIRQWAEKKGFTVVTSKVSESGKVGYFYFRLGQDPALESQQIQGYVAQKPEVKHFRFNVRGEQAPAAEAPQMSPKRPMRPKNPNTNI